MIEQLSDTRLYITFIYSLSLSPSIFFYLYWNIILIFRIEQRKSHAIIIILLVIFSQTVDFLRIKRTNNTITVIFTWKYNFNKMHDLTFESLEDTAYLEHNYNNPNQVLFYGAQTGAQV